MAGIGHHAIFGFGPGFVQFMRGVDRAHGVITALHDNRRNFADTADIDQ